MSLDELTELIRFMEAHGLVELEIEEEGKRVRLRKGPEGVTGVAPLAAMPAPAAAEEQTAAPAGGLVEIKSSNSPDNRR